MSTRETEPADKQSLEEFLTTLSDIEEGDTVEVDYLSTREDVGRKTRTAEVTDVTTHQDAVWSFQARSEDGVLVEVGDDRTAYHEQGDTWARLGRVKRLTVEEDENDD